MRLLLEVGVEEVPARFLPGALRQLEEHAAQLLERERLEHGQLSVLGTPRRLALEVAELAATQAGVEEWVRGPSVRAAFDQAGLPTPAAHGFARAQGVRVEELVSRENGGGAYLFVRRFREGQPAQRVLEGVLPELLSSLEFPRPMRWGEGSHRFVRPVRWLVALLDEAVLPFEWAGVRAGRATRGHRFWHAGPVELPRAESYRATLAAHLVLADPAERLAAVEREVVRAAREAGGRAVIPPGLLREVADLLEYPTAFGGAFPPTYLSLPREVLTTVMEEHQRFFPLEDAAGRLLPAFVAVRNGTDEDLDLVRRGNEKVLRARLADALFFYREDLKQDLERRRPALRHIMFQESLGTMEDKAERVLGLTARLVRRLGLRGAEAAATRRAAFLCKADLTTHMVYEYGELQGIMGREYARAGGEEEAVATAIFEHLLPRGAEDELPRTPAGRVVALADKLDTLAGSFRAGLVPTGSQDPYGLRRQALGLLRILLDMEADLPLGELVQWAWDLQTVEETPGSRTLLDEFLRARLRGLLLEAGVASPVADAVLTADADRPDEVRRRALALQDLLERPELGDICTAFRRADSLSRDAQSAAVREELLNLPQERELWRAVGEAATEGEDRLAAGDYAGYFAVLARLRPVVDRFFEAVLVMAEESELRRNRLALLRRVSAVFGRVADWTALFPLLG